MAQGVGGRTVTDVKTAWGVLVAGVVVLSLTAVAPAAQAEDRRPCVSKVEYQSAVGRLAHMSGKVSRYEAESRWEMVGRGDVDPEFSDKQTRLVVYEACGYPQDVASVWAVYSTDTRKLVGLYRDGGRLATPTGRP